MVFMITLPPSTADNINNFLSVGNNNNNNNDNNNNNENNDNNDNSDNNNQKINETLNIIMNILRLY